MPKNRKTREQKFLSDLRRQRISQTTVLGETPLSENSSVVINTNSTKIHVAPKIMTSTYAYLAHDLWKTLFLTLSIVILELFLRFFVIK